ncbi:hypothetical protein NDU88_008772 [Pleurodeles waltl]|uniref:Uncharacterized protein n=1 Tax=Pleurodeles waltl TaxID=8319 RepID=A0AAV7QSP0_PLEWA|nr:hypothetical protein NDU88_008772 [Pleurodeles waltl]
MGTRVLSFLGNASPPATRITRRAEVLTQAPRVKSPRGPRGTSMANTGLMNQKGRVPKMCCFRCVSRRQSLRTHTSKTKQSPGCDGRQTADRNPS